ncbi:MAG: MltA domain-containing protein [Paracoccaceae bacterium]
MTDAAAQGDVTHTVLNFEELQGWPDDDHNRALDVFRSTCRDMRAPDWVPICALAETQTNARTFFELFFRPVLIEDGAPALFTGYFEPELSGSRSRSGRFRFPLYRLPPEAKDGQWYSRADIEDQALLSGRGLEIAWVDDPVDVFFLQIQGSGRIRLTDGSVIRVGYAGANGHEYRSIGQELVRRGVFQPHQVSAQVISNWVKSNPAEGEDLLRHNPSFVFFRVVRKVPAERGPLGAMNRSVTEMRSVAVDPAYVPLGAPVWVEKRGRRAFNRLMIAQDTGSAIKGAQRADIFFGTGYKAGRRAGQVRDPGRMVVLMPIQEAFARAEGINP